MKNTIINGKALPAMSIGTVQLGMNYGIANEGGQPSQEKSFAMLRTAFENGVASLDTARAYGNSEEVIGAFLKTWEGELPYITTKIRYAKPEGLSFEANAIASIEESLQRLGVKKVDCLLYHSPNDIFEQGFGINHTLFVVDAESLGTHLYLLGRLLARYIEGAQTILRQGELQGKS